MIIVEKNFFNLSGLDFSYIIAIDGGNNLINIYYGKKIENFTYSLPNQSMRAFCPTSPNESIYNYTAQEYPSCGHLDYRIPAYEITHNNCKISQLKYKSHEILKEKPLIKGLPSSNGTDSQTLKIVAEDISSGLVVELFYTVYDAYNVLSRSAKFIAGDALTINNCMSACIDLPSNDYKVTYLSGTWANERNITTQELKQGIIVLSSNKGTSSHQINPFVAVSALNTDEERGEVFAMSLIYSGNHITQIEKTQYGEVRIAQGINSSLFEWKLENGEEFATPECLLVYSINGFEDMSHTYHRFINNNIINKYWQKRQRPILINNWEATYFDFNEDKIVALAQQAKDLGIEMMVLDDGWFGKRNSCKTSLGDWYVDKAKIPNGLSALCDKIRKIGLKFGLWFEPEMISRDSELCRNHPDWILQSEFFSSIEIRYQCVLDLTRIDVRDYIVNELASIIDSNAIEYIKWDMNRYLSDLPDGKSAHKYVLGLYDILEKITSRFPSLLIEGCSGGGGRFDLGMLCYCPQIWVSDNTDPIARLKIQRGTNYIYPYSTMGAHVTASPNHQTCRATSVDTRFNVAILGTLGYELDLMKLTDEDKNIIKKQLIWYKKNRADLLFGESYNITLGKENGVFIKQLIAPSKKKVYVIIVISTVKAENYLPKIKLKNIEKNIKYLCKNNNKVYYGEELMLMGINIDIENKEYASVLYEFEQI